MGGVYNQVPNTYNQNLVLYNDFTPVAPNPPFTPPALFWSPACTSTNGGIGWSFYLVQPGLAPIQMFPATGCSIDMDTNSDVTRSISGMQLPPEEAAKIDFSRDSVWLFLEDNGVIRQMGVFRFSEISIQKGAVKTASDDMPQDWTHVSLGDRALELIRNTGEAQTVVKGTDPTQVMRTISSNAGVPAAVAASTAPMASDTSWDGGTTDLEKFIQMSKIAGHRNPWTDNAGILRSVAANMPTAVSYSLLDLDPQAGSIVVTPTYLGAPNRVIVTDNTYSTVPIRGQWDAPGSAPHSAGQRGFVQTMMVDESGLGSTAAATARAREIGESLTCRQLNAQIKPTWLLDGPVVLNYDGAQWRVQSWSVSTDAGATMSVQAIEILGVG